MSERMIRINNCRECQECIRAFKGDGVGVPDDCVLELAPPKDWAFFYRVGKERWKGKESKQESKNE